MGKSAGSSGDIGSGHAGYPPTLIVVGGSNVLTNGHPAERVIIDKPQPENAAEQPPELRDACVRLAINPTSSRYAQDQFILTSTDGSVRIVKTVADDQIPGDDFLDLTFEQLDTSKNYKLEQIDSSSGEAYTYFDDLSHSAIGVQSPAPSDSDADESEH